mmetsp:Transcript_65793/g.203784  ORF Transcript_65793/g.203784 Transcript_65793/m.203784 type:complete len:249 (+) Transcript_65793:285-1031(+)
MVGSLLHPRRHTEVLGVFSYPAVRVPHPIRIAAIARVGPSGPPGRLSRGLRFELLPLRQTVVGRDPVVDDKINCRHLVSALHLDDRVHRPLLHCYHRIRHPYVLEDTVEGLPGVPGLVLIVPSTDAGLVSPQLVLVRQQLVRRAHLLKSLVGRLVVVEVGVARLCKVEIRLLDLVLRRTLADAEHLVRTPGERPETLLPAPPSAAPSARRRAGAPRASALPGGEDAESADSGRCPMHGARTGHGRARP